MVPFNTREGLNFAVPHHERAAAFEQDIRDGVPLYMLLARHTNAICPKVLEQDYLAHWLRMLRDAGLGSFGQLRDNPLFEEVPIPVDPVALQRASWDEGNGRG